MREWMPPTHNSEKINRLRISLQLFSQMGRIYYTTPNIFLNLERESTHTFGLFLNDIRIYSKCVNLRDNWWDEFTSASISWILTIDKTSEIVDTPWKMTEEANYITRRLISLGDAVKRKFSRLLLARVQLNKPILSLKGVACKGVARYIK